MPITHPPSGGRFYGFRSGTQYGTKLYYATNVPTTFTPVPISQDNIIEYDTTVGWDLNVQFDPTGIVLDNAGTAGYAVADSLVSYNGNLYAMVGYAQVSNGVGRRTDLMEFNGVSWSGTALVIPSNRTFLFGETVIYNGNMYFAEKASASNTGNTVYESDGATTFSTSLALTPYGFLNDDPKLCVYNGDLYFSFNNEIHTFDGASWTLNQTFAGVDSENGLNAIYDMTVFNGKLYVVMTTNTNIIVSPFSVTMDQEIWIYDGVSWTLLTTLTETTDIFKARFCVYDASTLMLFTSSNFTDELSMWRHTLPNNWTRDFTQTSTFDQGGTVIYLYVPEFLKYSVNSLLYVSLTRIGIPATTDVWTYPIEDL